MAAIFSPPRLIGLHCRTRANLRFERIDLGLHLCFHPMQQFHHLPAADRDPVEREEVQLDLANRQTHHRAERWRSDWQAHTDASLPNYLIVPVHRGLVPFLTPATPPLVDTMLRHLDGRRWRDINDLS